MSCAFCGDGRRRAEWGAGAIAIVALAGACALVASERTASETREGIEKIQAKQERTQKSLKLLLERTADDHSEEIVGKLEKIETEESAARRRVEKLGEKIESLERELVSAPRQVVVATPGHADRASALLALGQAHKDGALSDRDFAATREALAVGKVDPENATMLATGARLAKEGTMSSYDFDKLRRTVLAR